MPKKPWGDPPSSDPKFSQVAPVYYYYYSCQKIFYSWNDCSLPGLWIELKFWFEFGFFQILDFEFFINFKIRISWQWFAVYTISNSLFHSLFKTDISNLFIFSNFSNSIFLDSNCFKNCFQIQNFLSIFNSNPQPCCLLYLYYI